MSEENGKENETEEFSEFAQNALRGQRQIDQQILAQSLITATFSTEPETIIAKICGAAMMYTPQDVKDLDVDLELLKTIYIVNNALTNFLERKIDDTHVMRKVYWGFHPTQENFDKYIKPWFVNFSYYIDYITEHLCAGSKIKHQDFLLLTPDHRCKHVFAVIKDKDVENADYVKAFEAKWKFPIICPKCGKEVYPEHLYCEPTTVVDDNPFWHFFFEACRYLSSEGHVLMVNSFRNWAMPIVQHAKKELSKLVNPSLYSEVLKTLTAQEIEKSESGMGKAK